MPEKNSVPRRMGRPFMPVDTVPFPVPEEYEDQVPQWEPIGLQQVFEDRPLADPNEERKLLMQTGRYSLEEILQNLPDPSFDDPGFTQLHSASEAGEYTPLQDIQPLLDRFPANVRGDIDLYEDTHFYQDRDPAARNKQARQVLRAYESMASRPAPIGWFGTGVVPEGFRSGDELVLSGGQRVVTQFDPRSLTIRNTTVPARHVLEHGPVYRSQKPTYLGHGMFDSDTYTMGYGINIEPRWRKANAMGRWVFDGQNREIFQETDPEGYEKAYGIRNNQYKPYADRPDPYPNPYPEMTLQEAVEQGLIK